MDEQHKFEGFLKKLLIPQNSYAAAKIHAQQLDDLLGYQCRSIEEKLQLRKMSGPTDFKLHIPKWLK